jgi:1,4-dihydroxy-2-naphthoate polyprenyltransferase
MNLKLNAWLSAFRLRTLPLSLSSILMGSFLAYNKAQFNIQVFFSCVLTTIFLQILSNLANDYGDWKNGTDNVNRVGPPRAMQRGALTSVEIKASIVLFSILSLVSGIYLVIIGTNEMDVKYFVFFIVLGLLAILAAIKYTVGKNPYGYIGLGDFFVFLFFGIVAVLGTLFLHAHSVDFIDILPSVSMGCLAAGVININNMRDIQNDAACGKITVAVRLGKKRAKVYHGILLSVAILSIIVYTILKYQWSHQFLFLIVTPLLYQHFNRVNRNTNPEKLDKELKKLALITLLFSLTCGMGFIRI